MVKLLILTGQRRDEVGSLRWSEVDLEGAVWKLPGGRAKNGNAHDVPLSGPALDVLADLPRIGDEFVLTNTGTEAASNFSENKRRLDELLPPGMPPWCLHDLRRTLATGLQRLGIRLEVTEAMLNHVSGSRDRTPSL